MLGKDPVDRRRRAERGDAKLSDELEVGLGVEARIGVIEHHRRPHEPRREQAPPGRLGPAGIGQGPVHVVLAQVQPIAPGEGVAEAVGVVPGYHLGHRRGARREVDEHQVAGAGRRHVGAAQAVGGRLARRLDVDPSLARATGDEKDFQGRAAGADVVDLGDAVGGNDGDAGAGLVDAVLDVLGRQHGGGGHAYHAELHAGDHRLVPGGNARDHDEGEVALPGPQLQQQVGQTVGRGVEVGE